MPDVRELLERGAAANPGMPDIDELWRRARIVRRRRAAAGGVLLAAVVVVVALVGTLGGHLLRTSEQPSPATPPVRALPAVGAPLVAGATYTADSVDLDYAFTVPGDGWMLAAAERGWISLHQDDLRVNLQRWTGVLDPGADPVGPDDELPLPDDLATWLAGHPGVEVDRRRTETVAGTPWARLDLRVSPLRRTPEECLGRPCRLLAVTEAEPVEVLAGERATVRIAGDGAGPLVLLSADPNPGSGRRPLTDLVASLRRRT